MSLNQKKAGTRPRAESPEQAQEKTPERVPGKDSDRVPVQDSGKAWFVYLLECADDTLYCGVTTDLSRRLDQHNGLVPGGARYTRARRPVVLAAWALAGDRSAAQKMEYAIRKLPRMRKVAALKALASDGDRPSGSG